MEVLWIGGMQDFRAAPLTYVRGFPAPAGCCCRVMTKPLGFEETKEEQRDGSMSTDARQDSALKERQTHRDAVKFHGLPPTSVSQATVGRVL